MTITDTFIDFFNTPKECSYCGGTENLTVSKTDNYGEACMWHHETCREKAEAESQRRAAQIQREIANDVSRDEWEE